MRKGRRDEREEVGNLHWNADSTKADTSKKRAKGNG